ncbi:MAG: hypothetical protein AVDCRST_MAG19-1019 [uncultured Thermomicrobiales bacterium]|uniref:Uncharacterized protein n=1 Tax=uncultured Thermomicrobiales bacterium TaxID=1645740 RepID=A0A6J4UMU1_9BACT|nr:MAG: hypothetical protein AVDCRST_MAG19-1019 [uncultured Thermomicrobiales bacterium]
MAERLRYWMGREVAGLFDRRWTPAPPMEEPLAGPPRVD